MYTLHTGYVYTSTGSSLSTGRGYTWKYNMPGADMHSQQSPFYTYTSKMPRLHMHLQHALFYTLTCSMPRFHHTLQAHFRMIKQQPHLHMQQHKEAFTHKHTAAPCWVYINSQLYTQQALFIHAHAAFPCLLMCKQQARFKHAQPADLVRIYMHNQQDTFTYAQATGLVYVRKPYSPCLPIHLQRFTFVHAPISLAYPAGVFTDAYTADPVYTYTNKNLCYHMQISSDFGSKELIEEKKTSDSIVREQQRQQAPFTHGTCSKLHLHFNNLQNPFTHAQTEETVCRCSVQQVSLQICMQ